MEDRWKESNTFVASIDVLSCFPIDARLNLVGEPVLYEEQYTTLWSSDLISKGGYFLHRATSGDVVSKYHIEAGIAYWATQRADNTEKWENMLQLYNRLLQIEYSPIAALNRTFVLSKAKGKIEAILETEKLALTDYHFYYSLLGMLYTGVNDRKAIENYKNALAIARSDADKNMIHRTIEKLE